MPPGSTSAAQYTQTNRPMGLTTPLGADVLLLEAFTTDEAMSKPFHIAMDVLSQAGSPIAFEKLLGQKVTIRLDMSIAGSANTRYFNGAVSRVTEGREVPGSEGEAKFHRYRLEAVPQFFFLRYKTNCRIFQQITVLDILKQVLTGFDVSYQVTGTFQQRDYCVQYRETDFAFACRLMEEEGIYYFFKHTQSGHQMVLANTPQGNPALTPSPTINFESLARRASRGEMRILEWVKSQEVRPGKTTLWDSCFEQPGNNLQSLRPVPPSVTVGTVTHMLNAGANSAYEIYDYPGGYAQRFDGIDPGGGARAGDLAKIQPDGNRTVGIRMAQETLPAIQITGASDCRHLSSGCQFTLAQHTTANGSYVLTRVKHTASVAGTYTTNEPPNMVYENEFDCLPLGLPFQPPQVTPKPRIAGTQPALVVGTPGEEIFTDKYGRVKVQFDWDRLGQKNANSSCWVRVATPWGGKQWGTIRIPRIGMEVIVAFEEGDPDRPIIVGSVYNANQMPPYTLPDNKTQSGVKSRSTLKGTADNFNELRFEDKKDSEEVYFHAEKDFNRVVENNDTLKVGFEKHDKGDQTIDIFNNQAITIGAGKAKADDGSRTLSVWNNETITIGAGKAQAKDGSQTVDIFNDQTLTVGSGKGSNKAGSQTVTIWKDQTETLKTGNRTVTIEMGNDALNIKMGNHTTKLDMGNQSTKVSLGKIETEAMQSIELKVGGSSIKIDQMGVTIKGMMISIEGQIQTTVKGVMTTVTGSAMLQLSGGIIMIG